MSFLFWVDRDAYCNLVLRDEDNSSSAVRFSGNERFPSAFLRVRDTYEFSEVQALELPDLRPGDQRQLFLPSTTIRNAVCWC